MKVTVLMPIYNAERFLHEAIDSLLAQTSNQWKLICIDDGSTDSSKAIVEEFCKKDSRIKLICQENAGPAVARARAIEIADTEYVSILDSDDAYAPDYVEKMLARAEETDADIVVPDVEYFNEGKAVQPNQFATFHLSSDMLITDGKQAFAMTIPWKLHGWMMIRTSLAKKYYTKQQASYSKFNSDEYITRLLYLKSKITALCSALYRYCVNPNSITRKPSLKIMDYLVTDIKLLDIAYSEELNNSIVVNIYNEYYSTYFSLKRKCISILKGKEQQKAKEIQYLTFEKFYSKFQWSKLCGSTFRTKVKFVFFIFKEKFIYSLNF